MFFPLLLLQLYSIWLVFASFAQGGMAQKTRGKLLAALALDLLFLTVQVLIARMIWRG